MSLLGLKAIFFSMVFVVLTIMSVLLVNRPQDVNVAPSEIYETTKVVLVWNHNHEKTPLYLGKVGYDLFSKCPVSDCYLTINRSVLPIEDFAAIIFKDTNCVKITYHDLPSSRHLQQRYIFINNEAPIRFLGNSLSKYVYKSFYNWTISYRFDADFVHRHGYITSQPSAKKINESVLSKKTRSVAWMVSNCKTATNNREQLAKKLQQYIDVDIYGKCGNLTCARTRGDACRKMIAEKYWFYLSFENSDCLDYTTEKLYETLGYYIVPIVYGGGDYNDIKVAPPHSVIDVKSFKKIETLAKYLKFLIENQDIYMEFFKWKLKYSISRSGPEICDLCKRLHDPKEPPKTYDDIKVWWFGKNHSTCKSKKQLQKFG